MKKRILLVSGLFLAMAIAGPFLIFVVQPACLILRCTGFYCAGCGGQRMLLSLFEGDLSGAFQHNPFLFLLLPLLLGYAVWEAVHYIRGERLLCQSRRFLWIFTGVLLLGIVFTVMRNLPGISFLGP